MRSLNHLGSFSYFPSPIASARLSPLRFGSFLRPKVCGSVVGKHRFGLRDRVVQIKAFGEDSGMSLLDDWGDDEWSSGYVLSSSEGEDADEEYALNPLSDVDLPTSSTPTKDSLTVTAHRLAMIGKGHQKHRVKVGILIALGLIFFITLLLIFVDWCAWKIVRLPLEPFYLLRPFIISGALVSFVGYVCVPLLNGLKICRVVRQGRSSSHVIQKPTPTLGGLLFVPVGVGVAKFIAGFSSAEVSGAAVTTLAFAVIGLLDDIILIVKNHKSSLSAWIKFFLEVAVGTWFSFWLDTSCISSPYSMKMIVPLPAPFGLVSLGKYYYSLLTSLCFVSMGTGITLTDGFDGLASGTAALAFIAMSIAVLPICPEMAIFGASMAGACVGFLLHDRYKAAVFMGDTGSLALGGALAAMAACTGMFFPLFISSGIFFFEASSVVMQGVYYKTTKHFGGVVPRVFRISHFLHNLGLHGFKEPFLVASVYVISSLLALVGGYVGLISA